MKSIRVAVHGASGRMGQEVVDALCHEPDMQMVGAVDLKATEERLPLPHGSGTALSTARAMAQARGKSFSTPQQGKTSDSRGEQVQGIAIHSVRLPGLLAHQEVLLGGPGQTLSIRHDTISRECYMPGVMLAIKEVVKHKGLIYGLDTLLGLQEGR